MALSVAVVSYVAAKLASVLAVPPKEASALWPGNAVLVSVLLLVPRSATTVIALGTKNVEAFVTSKQSQRIGDTRLYLGSHGYRWLAACAEYPVIEWPLTLYLGKALMPPGTFDPILGKLARLPWFRNGSMPQWLRLSLLQDAASGSVGFIRKQR